MRTYSTSRGMLAAFGLRLPSGAATSFHRRARPELPEVPRSALEPVLECHEAIEQRIRKLHEVLETTAASRHPGALRLREVNGVGPIPPIALVPSVDDPTRFAKSRTVGSWAVLGPGGALTWGQ